ASRLATQQLPSVGILFLRHQAAAGGKFVGQDEEAELLRGEHHEVFREAREVRGDNGESIEIVEREVAIARGVEAVGRRQLKAQLARDGIAVDVHYAARQRARA